MGRSGYRVFAETIPLVRIVNRKALVDVDVRVVFVARVVRPESSMKTSSSYPPGEKLSPLPDVCCVGLTLALIEFEKIITILLIALINLHSFFGMYCDNTYTHGRVTLVLT